MNLCRDTMFYSMKYRQVKLMVRSLRAADEN